MPSTANPFPTVQVYDASGTSYTNNTIEAASARGTALSILPSTPASGDYCYIGGDSRFDMVIFDMNAGKTLSSIVWEYHNGAAWTQFAPMSGNMRYEDDGQDNEITDFNFSGDGVEIFPANIMPFWSTTAVNSITKYWVRVSGTASSAPTAFSIRIRPLTSYATTKDVFDMLQLGEITGTSDFTESTIPPKLAVEQYIQSAQGEIDFQTQKSWRPTTGI